MGNVVESLRRKQEEASTRRQLLVLRSKLEREIRESEVPPSVAVSSEEEAPEEPTEEPPEKPTEELAEEPTEKPTKELAKEDGESDEDAWGRWRWPAEDARSSCACGRGARDSTSKRGAASSSTYSGAVPDLWPGGGRGSTSGGRDGVVIAYGGRAGGAYGAGATVPLEPVPEPEDAGGEAKKKKRKRRKKKASQACAGDVVMVEEDPAESAGGVGDISVESAGGVGDIDLGAEGAGGVGDIGVESAGRVDQKKRKKKKGARSWYHRLTPKRTPLWYHRLVVCRAGQKKRRKKKGVRKTAPVEEPPEEEEEPVPLQPAPFPPPAPLEVEPVPLQPAPFPPPAPLEVAPPAVATPAVAPAAVAPMVVAASQGVQPRPSADPRVRVRASAALPAPPLPPPPPGHVGVYVLPAADPVPDPPRFGPRASGSSQVPRRWASKPKEAPPVPPKEAPPVPPKKAPPKRERERSVSI